MKQIYNNQLLLKGMKDRFTKLGTSMLGALCLLSTCGLTVSCHDDYDLPNHKPSFLGESIYDELASRSDRTFNTTLRLVNDLNYQDVLAKTGSLTLFVADDDAYKQFFATTKWTDGAGNPIRSYEQLSTNQKRYLFNNAMLSNPYLLEMMCNTQNNGKYLCLRQGTAVNPTDSVPRWDTKVLPVNQTEKNIEDPNSPENVDFWRLAHQEDSIYMAIDASAPMMTHFLEGQMRNKLIKNTDVAFLLNHDDEWWPNEGEKANKRSFIYNREVVDADVTCTNGYYHVLEIGRAHV